MKKYITMLSLAAFVGVSGLGGLTGCSTTGSKDPQAKEDSRVTSEVKDALKHSPVFKFKNVQVASANGKVQLSGFTLDPKEKQAAESIAKRVDGVREVQNDISVQH
jgi:osmotically-inducible protein OsmY